MKAEKKSWQQRHRLFFFLNFPWPQLKKDTQLAFYCHSILKLFLTQKKPQTSSSSCFVFQEEPVEGEFVRRQVAPVQHRRRSVSQWCSLVQSRVMELFNNLSQSFLTLSLFRGDSEAWHVHGPCPHGDLPLSVWGSQFTWGQDLHRPLHLRGPQWGRQGVRQGNRPVLCENRRSDWLR